MPTWAQNIATLTFHWVKTSTFQPDIHRQTPTQFMIKWDFLYIHKLACSNVVYCPEHGVTFGGQENMQYTENLE